MVSVALWCAAILLQSIALALRHALPFAGGERAVSFERANDVDSDPELTCSPNPCGSGLPKAVVPSAPPEPHQGSNHHPAGADR